MRLSIVTAASVPSSHFVVLMNHRFFLLSVIVTATQLFPSLLLRFDFLWERRADFSLVFCVFLLLYFPPLTLNTLVVVDVVVVVLEDNVVKSTVRRKKITTTYWLFSRYLCEHMSFTICEHMSFISVESPYIALNPNCMTFNSFSKRSLYTTFGIRSDCCFIHTLTLT